MQSRRDQVQAHMFVMGRLSSGMQRAEPDAPDTPTARTWRGIMWGLLVAVLAAVVTTLYGLISPGGATSWRTDGALVVVKDSGARYLYVGGTLHPVLNEASARLLAGDKLSVQQVAAASLGDTPRGTPLGIVGAPDGLPKGALDRGTWSVCAGRKDTGTGGTSTVTSVVIGTEPGGDELGAKEGVLVSSPHGGVQLLWHGRRFAVDTKHGAAAALGWAGTTAPYPVGDAFLASLAAGPDLAAPEVPGRGGAGPQLAGAASRTGQLFTADGGQHYLLRKDGLVPLTDTLHRLVLGDPRTQAQAYGGGVVSERTVGAADLAAHQVPASAAAALAADLPAKAPHPVSAAAGQDVCARVASSGSGHTTTVALVAAAQVPGGTPDAEPGVRAGCLAADRIWVRPGSGALVTAHSTAGTGASRYLVTDAGAAYPVPDDDALKQLGYSADEAVRLPAPLLDLLPTGPSLDPQALARGGIVQADQSASEGTGSERVARTGKQSNERCVNN
ncbi:type VII secretion protein EccB [Streptomyces sp. NBC_00846]|uniref:type VII secretion protein EccB n=1 Tax=Streptomyces sp. NBC_00846 TaxID=2975849 RepID=UPI00386D04CB|nr:type VII secretion protein EccB [Streptomyces sp. NBC_00846]